MKKINLTNLFKKNWFKINKEKKLWFAWQVWDTGWVEMEWTQWKFINKAPYYEQISPLIISVVSETKVYTDNRNVSFTLKDIEKVLKENKIPFTKKWETLLVDLEK